MPMPAAACLLPASVVEGALDVHRVLARSVRSAPWLPAYWPATPEPGGDSWGTVTVYTFGPIGRGQPLEMGRSDGAG
jgi:hypothetical protein